MIKVNEETIAEILKRYQAGETQLPLHGNSRLPRVLCIGGSTKEPNAMCNLSQNCHKENSTTCRKR